MKCCPFCAEEIQDAAIVCRYCGGDLPSATSNTTVTERPQSGRRKWIALGMVSLLALLALVSMLRAPAPTPRRETAAANAVAEPDEPCTVEAPAAARQAAQNWCEGGVFTKVNVSTDANNFIVVLQFSQKGQRSWQNQKFTILNRFRSLTDEMATKTDMNVAFSLHNTDSQMLGGCARQRDARKSTCNAK